MRSPRLPLPFRGAALCAALLLPLPLAAQAGPLLPAKAPLVEKLSFEGVENIGTGDLRGAIETAATRCRTPFFYPFCKFSDGGFFKERRFLDAEELRRDELRIRVFYWLRGYRQAEVSSSVVDAGDGVRITFQVDEGPPTEIGSSLVRQSESVLSNEQIARASLPAEATPVDVEEVDSAAARLRARLYAGGYGNAQVHDTIRIAGPLSAAVEYQVEPGPVTTVGEVLIRGNEQVSERTIRRTFDVETGDVFRRNDLVEAQRRLYRSGLFRSARLEAGGEADTAKTITVTVDEAPFHAVRTGLGITTIDFVQTQAEYTRYNWLGGARRLDLRATVGNLLAPQLFDKTGFGSAVPEGIGEVDAAFLDPTWQLSADVTQPFFLTSKNSLGLTIFAQRRSVLGIVIDRGYGASAAFTRRLAEDVPLSLTYRFERTTVEAGELYYCINFGVCRPTSISALQGTQAMSPLGVRIFAQRTDDPLNPTRGWTAEANVEHASEFTLSDFRYNRAWSETARYVPLGPGVLAGRLRGGYVRPIESTAEAVGLLGTNDAILHPRKRFYAGGARSVRGFGENQLGPRILTISPGALLATPDDPEGGEPCTAESIADGTCDPNVVESGEFQPRPLGGNSVIEANIEYRFPLFGPIGGTVFVDAATVGDRNLNVPPGARRSVTPGFGFRYVSPVGPVRLDLGIRPTLVETLPVVTQITGPDGEPRLVQLDTRKRYDPTEGSGGVFSQVLNRLQLHLSIGQAF